MESCDVGCFLFKNIELSGTIYLHLTDFVNVNSNSGPAFRIFFCMWPSMEKSLDTPALYSEF